MIVIGIGSTSAATVGDVMAAIVAVETQAGVSADLIVTLSRGEPERPILMAALRHGIDCRVLPATELAARNNDCVTKSTPSFEVYGIWSVAEAAALAGAGQNSRLVLPRQTFAQVTAAVAASQDIR